MGEKLIFEVIPFVIIIIFLLFFIIYVLRDYEDIRKQVIPHVVIIIVLMLFICWKIIRTDYNNRVQRNFKPVLKKMDELIKTLDSVEKARAQKKTSKTDKKKSHKKPKDQLSVKTPESKAKPYIKGSEYYNTKTILRKLDSNRQFTKLQIADLKAGFDKKIANINKKIDGLNKKYFDLRYYGVKNKKKHIFKIKEKELTKTNPPFASKSPDNIWVKEKLCIHGRKSVHVKPNLSLLTLRNIYSSRGTADFDLTLPYTGVHRFRDMKEGSRIPFEWEEKPYYFELISIELDCVQVAIIKQFKSKKDS